MIPSRSQPVGHEVCLVEDVHMLDQAQGRQGRLLPFYGGDIDATEKMGYWVASRRVSSWEDDAGKIVLGTEVDLHVVDQGLDLKRPTRAVLNVQVLCTNRDLPGLLKAGDTLILGTGSAPVVVLATLMTAPTAPLRPPLRHASFWRCSAPMP